MDEAQEALGQAIDRVEYLAAALTLPISDSFHVRQLKTILPEVIFELKTGFIAVTGENPWEGQDA